MSRTLDLTADIIDSRDIIARIRELEEKEDALKNAEDAEALEDAEADFDEDERTELAALRTLDKEAPGDDWSGSAVLVRDSYFTEYAQELADDIGAINKDAGWPLNHIDWDAAADALKMDYTSVEINGETYWVR